MADMPPFRSRSAVNTKIEQCDRMRSKEPTRPTLAQRLIVGRQNASGARGAIEVPAKQQHSDETRNKRNRTDQPMR